MLLILHNVFLVLILAESVVPVYAVKSYHRLTICCYPSGKSVEFKWIHSCECCFAHLSSSDAGKQLLFLAEQYIILSELYLK